MAGEAVQAHLGKSIVVRGEVRGSEDLIIEGRVEGSVMLNNGRLTIGPSARVQADLAARDVLVLGAVIGNISASGRVELRAGSEVIGDIRSTRLAVEDNAVFRGKVELAVSGAVQL